MKRKTSPENVHNFLKMFISSHGYAPTLREIAAGVGVSTPIVEKHLARLEGQGAITHAPGRARAIALTEP